MANRKLKTDSQAHQRLLKIQKRLYGSLQAEADRLLGTLPEAIQRYQAEYEREFRAARDASLRFLSKRELVEKIRRSDVTFIADYHTFAQAQRTALRLIRSSVRKGEKWMLGVELIPSHFQRELDQFQQGRISRERFLRLIRYEQEWGFPWEHYEPLFLWARRNGVRLIALNRPRPFLTLAARKGVRDSELKSRDQWAAGIITDLLCGAGGERARMIVLYGELHVSSNHLPVHLVRISRAYSGKALEWTTVHQNHDGLYWKLARRGREINTDAVKLRDGVYCVLSSPPWAKLQSLISWAEDAGTGHAAAGGSARRHEDEDADDEIAQDHLSVIRAHGRTLAEFFGVPAPSFDAVEVHTVAEADFIEHLAGVSAREWRLIRHHVNGNHRLYIPRAGIAYLGSPSDNGSAELAARCLYSLHTRTHEIFQPEVDDLFRLIIEAAFAFMGSLLINPRRKCDLPADHRRRLRQLKADEREAFVFERLAREISLDLTRYIERAAQTPPESRTMPPLPRGLTRQIRSAGLAPALMLAARYAGQILGRSIHQALMLGRISVDEAREMLLARGKPAGSNYPLYQMRVCELARVVSDLPVPPSKADHL
jgi:hypothetical protein